MGQVSGSSTVLIAMAPPAFDAEPETVLAAVADYQGRGQWFKST